MTAPSRDVDVRGARFTASVITVVLAVVLLTGGASLFAVVGPVGHLVSAPLFGAIAAGLALVAALLDAATGVCPGRETYLLVRRAASLRAAA